MSNAGGSCDSVGRAYAGPQAVEVVDEPVQRRSRPSGHVLHATVSPTPHPEHMIHYSEVPSAQHEH